MIPNEPNYEEEVKKVFPDAAIAPISAFGITMAYIVEDLSTGERLSKVVPDFEDDPIGEAWKKTYETLKTQGKL